MVSRRNAILAAGSVTVAGAAAVALSRSGPEHAMAGPGDAVEFYGAHQAGITTPAQDRLHFVAFDVITDDRAKLVQMLRDWTAAAARMTAGRDAGLLGAVEGQPEAPPDDTGEALGLPPSALTITVGFGPSLFAKFGLADRKPKAMADLPRFPGDTIKPEISGGDLCIQACANDPQVAVHAVRNLARIGFGVVSVRYSQLGFGRTSSTSTAQATPRNLMGFKDGTRNLKLEDGAELLDKHLWVQPDDGPQWMVGGSYLVSRRIRMIIETWDRTPLAEQETIFGRTKGEGAPMGKAKEFDEPDLSLMPEEAHVRLAHPSSNGDARLLRRGYNFVDGSDGLGRLDAGLFFLAYQRDPHKQFVPVQRSLARADVLNEYIRHTSSGLWAVPPGVKGPEDFWGSALFA
ncbi:peroxidase [Rhizocola hellebori]|uniref:Deferrochelatase n=1 Tax=Rhizocola hellebori TaxID=1392758 RepID=A0A8J3QCS2_9ACTN|nr:iron uptake transporter deferrochelatase/peroxidase subunit [Rhizocola hellebori]GIH07056.1 peroxidase [Rhizocola hellebori]